MPKQILTDVPACSARAPGRRMARLGLSLAFAALGLSGCAHQQSKPKEVPFEELQARLAGRYDNAAQARSDAQAGVADPHSALDLLIAPARAALIGPATFYVRQTAAADPGRHSQGLLLEQRIELRENQLAVVDQQVGPDGLLALSGSQEDPFYRFVRRGDAN